MSQEKLGTSERYIPIMVCPDCVRDDLQIDPRAENPTYPVIESTCSTHLIAKGKIHSRKILPPPQNIFANLVS